MTGLTVGDGALRRALVETCRRMNALGINQGKSGNASVRTSDDPSSLWVTPTAVSYERMTEDDTVRLAADGSWSGARPPSSEWRIHRDVLAARSDVHAVVHAHPPFATALACLRREIPPFHYMVAMAGGDSIRCAPYATFGTQALSDHALDALEGRKACLLANHGILALGTTLENALDLAVEVEALAGQYLRAVSAGEPVLLDAEEMARVVEKFKTYGRDESANQSTR